MKIRIAPISLIFCLVFLVQANSQPLTYDEGMEYNRMQQTFLAAFNLIINQTDLAGVDRLATTREQKEAFIIFNEQREALRPPDLRNKSEEEQRAACLELMEKSKLLETELKEKILLPHQVERLEQAAFLSQVMSFQGNYTSAINMPYYRQLFGISNQQKQQLRSIDIEKKKEIQKLRKEYDARIAKVESRSRKELRRLLTDKQEKIIEVLSGREFGESARQK